MTTIASLRLASAVSPPELWRSVTSATHAWLAEHNLWRIPGFGLLASLVDAVPGERELAVSMLQRGELVVVYPGGIRDSFKLSSQRQKLQWGKRAGFAKVAMSAGCTPGANT